MEAVRPRNTPFSILQILFGFSFIVVWLPLLRCVADGQSYSWGTTYFGTQFFSKGVTTDYFILPVFFLGFLLLFWSVHYAKNRMLFYGLLFIWFIHVFGNLSYDILFLGDTEFHGDTLGIHVSLSAIVFPLAILSLILGIWAVMKDIKMAPVAVPWNKRNRSGLWVILISTFVAAILFSLGTPHGSTDQVGVIIAIIQSFAWPFIFRPYTIKID